MGDEATTPWWDDPKYKEAVNKASALYRLGPDVGAGATIWARAIRDCLDLHARARASWANNQADLEAWERLHSSAQTLVFAIHQVLAFETAVRRLTGDDELKRARERFDRRCSDAEAIRDLVTHLDAYAVGEGLRQTGKRQPPLSPEHIESLTYWTNGSTFFKLGDTQLSVQDASQAALELAEVVERVRAKYLDSVEAGVRAEGQRRIERALAEAEGADDESAT